MKTMTMVSAPWCRPCATMKPIAREMCAKLGIPFDILDCEDDMAKVGEMNIGSVPTFIIFQGGKETFRWEGSLNPKKLEELLVGG